MQKITAVTSGFLTLPNVAYSDLRHLVLWTNSVSVVRHFPLTHIVIQPGISVHPIGSVNQAPIHCLALLSTASSWPAICTAVCVL